MCYNISKKPVEKMAIKDMMVFDIRASEVLIVDIPAVKFIREFREKLTFMIRKTWSLSVRNRHGQSLKSMFLSIPNLLRLRRNDS